MSFVYEVEFANSFLRDIKKLKKNKVIYKQIKSAVIKVAQNPFDISLKTHKVNIPSMGIMWSSRVTGDLRIIWEFNARKNFCILTLRLQGHDTVYK